MRLSVDVVFLKLIEVTLAFKIKKVNLNHELYLTRSDTIARWFAMSLSKITKTSNRVGSELNMSQLKFVSKTRAPLVASIC